MVFPCFLSLKYLKFLLAIMKSDMKLHQIIQKPMVAFKAKHHFKQMERKIILSDCERRKERLGPLLSLNFKSLSKGQTGISVIKTTECKAHYSVPGLCSLAEDNSPVGATCCVLPNDHKKLMGQSAGRWFVPSGESKKREVPRDRDLLIRNRIKQTQVPSLSYQ